VPSVPVLERREFVKCGGHLVAWRRWFSIPVCTGCSSKRAIQSGEVERRTNRGDAGRQVSHHGCMMLASR